MVPLRRFARVVNNEAAMERLGASIASLSLAGDAILLCGCVLATCVRPISRQPLTRFAPALPACMRLQRHRSGQNVLRKRFCAQLHCRSEPNRCFADVPAGPHVFCTRAFGESAGSRVSELPGWQSMQAVHSHSIPRITFGRAPRHSHNILTRACALIAATLRLLCAAFTTSICTVCEGQKTWSAWISKARSQQVSHDDHHHPKCCGRVHASADTQDSLNDASPRAQL